MTGRLPYRMLTISLTATALLGSTACATSTIAVWRAPTPPEGRPPATQAWARPDLVPIGQPRIAGGVAIVYVTDKSYLYLVGVDPPTGKILWRQSASPSFVSMGVAVQPSIVNKKVAYFRPDAKGNLFARLVLADPATGKDIAVTRPALFETPPLLCSNGVDVCTTARDTAKQKPKPGRLRADNGQYVAENTGLPTGARTIGPGGLLDLGGRNPETIGLFRDGKLAWRRPLKEAFPDGYSTDYGFGWAMYRKASVYVGAVLSKPSGATASGYSDDLSRKVSSAGLSESSGTVLWRDTGGAVGCLGALDGPENPDDPDSMPLAVRCRYHGVAHWPADIGKEPTFSGLDVTLEGFDVKTGKASWSMPAGPAESLSGKAELPVSAGPAQVLLAPDGEPVIVNLTNGERRDPAEEATFWCATRVRFTYREPLYFSGKPDNRRFGGDVGTICDAERKPATRVPSAAVTGLFGAKTDKYAVVSIANSLLGYRLA